MLSCQNTRAVRAPESRLKLLLLLNRRLSTSAYDIDPYETEVRYPPSCHDRTIFGHQETARYDSILQSRQCDRMVDEPLPTLKCGLLVGDDEEEK